MSLDYAKSIIPADSRPTDCRPTRIGLVSSLRPERTNEKIGLIG